MAFGFGSNVGRKTAATYLAQKYNGTAISLYKPVHDLVNTTSSTLHQDITDEKLLINKISRVWGFHQDTLVFPKHLMNTLPEGPVFIYDLEWPCHAYYLRDNGMQIINIQNNKGKMTQTPKSISIINNTEWDHMVDNNGQIDIFYNDLDKIMECLT